MLGVTSKRRKLKWYGHVHCSSGLAKTILQGTVKGEEDKANRKEVGRHHQGMDMPGVCKVLGSSGEQRKMEETGCEVTCGAPTIPAVKGTGESEGEAFTNVIFKNAADLKPFYTASPASKPA